MPIVPILTACLVISVTCLMRAEFSGKRNQIYFFKPLSTLLIILVVLDAYFLNEVGNIYKTAILIGMLFSLGGDVALMFESSKAFLIGLVLFLCGHLAYTVAILQYGGYVWIGTFETLTVAIIGLLFYFYLYPGLNQMKVPTLLYLVVISLMLNVAILSFQSDAFNIDQAWYVAMGAVLFYISDAILAINKFKKPFKLNRVSLIFYFSGQLLIALSTHYTVPI